MAELVVNSKGGENPVSGEDNASDSPNSTPAANAGRRPAEGRIIRGTKPQDVPMLERRNWLIHLHYIRKDFETCKVLIGELLQETDYTCEYAVYVLGLIKRQEGDISASLELFQKAVTLNPNSSAAVKQVARSLFLLGKHKAALDTYTEALSLSPQEWEILHNMGVCYIYLKDYDQAIVKFERAVELSPQSLTFTQLGRVHLLKRDLGSATEVYSRAVQHNPEDSDLLSTLGLLYLETCETKKAFECLGSAITFDPSNPKAILAAGAMIQDHGDYDVALSKYRIAASVTPESPHLWNNIGMCFFGKKKHVAAVSCLKRAVYLAPFEWKILYNLGLIHLTLCQYASAYHFFRAAIGLHSNSGQLFMLLAVALTYLDDYENACQSYEQALSLDKENPLIHLNYAIALHNHGERRTAAKHFSLFQTKTEKHKPANPDKEVEVVAAKLQPILLVGEGFAARDYSGHGSERGQRGRGEKGLGRTQDVVWNDDFQDPDDLLSLRKQESPTDLTS